MSIAKHTLWRDIPGFEGLYEVSDQGQIRSISREVSCGQRGGTRVVRAHIIKGHVSSKSGHLRASLRTADGRTVQEWVHRAVAKAFIPNPEGHPFVLHGRGGPADNRVENLRWGTPADNAADRLEFGEINQWWATRTTCKRGHEMDDANTYVPPGKPNVRVCRKCHQVRKKQYREGR